MGHLRNTLIQHRDSARGSHRHTFKLNLQNTHLSDLHRHDPAFNKYARRLLESVARAAENIRRQGLDILARVGEPPGIPPSALEGQ